LGTPKGIKIFEAVKPGNRVYKKKNCGKKTIAFD
jgi:hypothetical protein